MTRETVKQLREDLVNFCTNNNIEFDTKISTKNLLKKAQKEGFETNLLDNEEISEQETTEPINDNVESDESEKTGNEIEEKPVQKRTVVRTNEGRNVPLEGFKKAAKEAIKEAKNDLENEPKNEEPKTDNTIWYLLLALLIAYLGMMFLNKNKEQ